MSDNAARPTKAQAPAARAARSTSGRPMRPLEALIGEPAGSRAPLVRELNAAADYLRFVRMEVSQLGANEIAKDRLPAAIREVDYIVEGTEKSSNAIMTAAEEVIAAKDLDPAAYQAFVAEKMTAIFLACAFQDLTTQRARRIQSTLHTVERRLSRLASRLGTREIPNLVDFAPAAPDGLVADGPPAPGEGNDQQSVDHIFEEWSDVDWR
jgi:chemotaxis protein CheZ